MSSSTANGAAAATTSSTFSPSVPIGIDLGHSYGCVAVWRNGSVDVIANDLGSRSTPALLSFTDKEILFGEAAQSQLASNLRQTVHHARRLTGLRFSHPTVQKLRQRVDYTIAPEAEDDASALPVVVVTKGGEEVRYGSSELISVMLQRMKAVADRYCGSDCKECVLAVPSFFSSQQRKAVEAAGQRAGLTVLSVLNEATAAALAFGLDLPRDAKAGMKTKESVVVIDVGGATSSVSILQSELGVLTLKCACFESELGGDDFDALLVEHFSSEFQRITGLSLAASHRAVARLSVAVEKLKRVLSSSTSASLELDGLYEGADFYSKISRAKFETLAAPLFRRISALILRALQQANLSPALVDHVCLIGGSSRMPRVAEIVKAALPGKDIKRGVNPEEAVAVGCTLQASLLAGRGSEWAAADHEAERTKRGELALSRGLGVEAEDGSLQLLLHKGSTLPARATVSIAQHRASPAPFLLRVYEGERALARHNRQLASLVIPASAPPPVTVSITVDKQRRTYVHAYTGKTVHAELTLEPQSGQEVKEQAVAEAETEDDSAAASRDSVYLERSARRRELYDWLLGVKEPRAVLDAAWDWMEGQGAVLDGEDEKVADTVWEEKKAEIERAVEDWKQREAQRQQQANTARADEDDVDDYVARLSVNGQSAGKAAADGGGDGEFDHEIADLD